MLPRAVDLVGRSGAQVCREHLRERHLEGDIDEDWGERQLQSERLTIPL